MEGSLSWACGMTLPHRGESFLWATGRLAQGRCLIVRQTAPAVCSKLTTKFLPKRRNRSAVA